MKQSNREIHPDRLGCFLSLWAGPTPGGWHCRTCFPAHWRFLPPALWASQSAFPEELHGTNLPFVSPADHA